MTGKIFALFFLAVHILFLNLAFSATLTITWQANSEPDLAGYRVYYGQSSGNYAQVIDVGNILEFTINNLDVNKQYFISLTAYDTNSNESGFSTEVSGYPEEVAGTPVDEPEVFILYQNYPNPFNPSTTIPYYLADDGKVILRILNTKGQTVRILVEEEKSAGMYRAFWDGKDIFGREVASGIYFASMETPFFRLSLPIVIFR
ncbi:MAG TPA: hypothetical protein ENH29_08020 [Bacteroidetes bacterium]|nr:hypothetical protein [Bacteroidota bacterium]